MIITFEQAVDALKQGQAVIMPTDTVCGVGVSVIHAASPHAVFQAKHRPENKPVAWLVAEESDLGRFGKNIPTYAYGLAKQYWPGALTLIVEASGEVPPAFRSGQGTIGLRLPAHDQVRQLIRAVGSPLAVSSANLSGQPAPTRLDLVPWEVVAQTAGILQGPDKQDTTASTVVDCTQEKPRIVRIGSVQLGNQEVPL